MSDLRRSTCDDVRAYIACDLGPEEEENFRRHLWDCPRCLWEAEQLLQVEVMEPTPERAGFPWPSPWAFLTPAVVLAVILLFRACPPPVIAPVVRDDARAGAGVGR